jgi:hypothetical protein
MTNTILTPKGESYVVLGPVQDGPHVWLVRHVRTCQLYLLQRVSQPMATLKRLILSIGPRLPKIRESWTREGHLYVLLSRAKGPGLNQYRAGDLDDRTLEQARSVQRILRCFGMRSCPPSALCLGDDGHLILRWIPLSTRALSDKLF